MSTRIIQGVKRSAQVKIILDGSPVSAYAGETLATVLFAEGTRKFYVTKHNQPRAPFCGMGTCFECRVMVKYARSAGSTGWVRACMTAVKDGMVVTTGVKLQEQEPHPHED